MEYKNQTDYERLNVDCPPKNFSSKDIDPVYRWVFDSLDDDRNFQSQYHKKPKRFLREKDRKKCKALGLSFFNDLDGSINRFAELKEFIGENVHSTLGTKIAKGKIGKADGVNGTIERFGHFTNHPSKKAKFAENFSILETL